MCIIGTKNLYIIGKIGRANGMLITGKIITESFPDLTRIVATELNYLIEPS